MRKLIVLTFLTLDGVMQAPGGKGEDPSGGFNLEGWSVPFFDEAMGEVMAQQMSRPFDLLLGRKTFDIFASYWPQQGNDEPINTAKKYVVSQKPVKTDWQGTETVSGDAAAAIKKLKQQEGPMLQVHGSSDLIQTLLANDLVDEIWLKIFPVTLGKGKRLFGKGAIPASFKLTDSKITPSGVIVAYYSRSGPVELGTF